VRNGGSNVTVNIPSTGIHTLNLWMREDGARIDRILLTTDINFSPSGTGPSESPPAGGGEDGRAEAPGRAVKGLNSPSAAALHQAPTAGQTYRLYYYAGPRRVAVRTVTSSSNALHFLHVDHLGSTSLTTDANGQNLARRWYYPFGAPRGSVGTLPTTRTYTGQYADPALNGLMFYNARYYDPMIGRFTKPDSLIPVPGNPQALNRFAYSLNNPLKFTDSSGHWVESALDIAFIAYGLYDISQNGLNWENGLSLAADVAGLILPAR